MLDAAKAAKSEGKLRAAYVYDETTGLKIFGHVATYVKSASGIKAFMRKADAEKFASSSGGSIYLASLFHTSRGMGRAFRRPCPLGRGPKRVGQ